MDITISNSSPQSNSSNLHYEDDYLVVYTVLMAMLMPFTIFGNTVIIVVILKKKKLQTISNMFVCSLAVADLMAGLVVTPVTIVMFWHPPAFRKNESSCMMTQFPSLLSLGASLLNLLFLAVDRFIAVTFPIKYLNHATKRKAAVVIGSMWVFLLMVSLLPAIGWNSWNYNKLCEFFRVMDKAYILFVAFIVIIALLGTTYVYIHICILAYMYSKKRHRQIRSITGTVSTNSEGGADQMGRNVYRRESKNIKVMAVIYFLFLCFWIPFLIGGPLQKVISKSIAVSEVKNFMFILALSNSAINPVVYALMKVEFRTEIRALLHLKS